jgi:hypothetical protein
MEDEKKMRGEHISRQLKVINIVENQTRKTEHIIMVSSLRYPYQVS